MVLAIIIFFILYQSIGIFLILKEELENSISSIFFLVFYPIILLYRFITKRS
jgi:hypothetical protein